MKIILIALSLICSETIMIEYGNDEYYHQLIDGEFVQVDNGNVQDGAPYDYILLEDKAVFYVNRKFTGIEILKGRGCIEVVNPYHFIFHGEIDNELILKLTY